MGFGCVKTPKLNLQTAISSRLQSIRKTEALAMVVGTIQQRKQLCALFVRRRFHVAPVICHQSLSAEPDGGSAVARKQT
jgi:hypothetical protein